MSFLKLDRTTQPSYIPFDQEWLTKNLYLNNAFVLKTQFNSSWGDFDILFLTEFKALEYSKILKEKFECPLPHTVFGNRISLQYKDRKEFLLAAHQSELYMAPFNGRFFMAHIGLNIKQVARIEHKPSEGKFIIQFKTLDGAKEYLDKLKDSSLSAILDEDAKTLEFQEYQSLLLMKKAFESSCNRPTISRQPSERHLRKEWINNYLKQ
ncbi:hypothetical protein [Legionella waltersii]|uniref:Uncharacterized protein n=1 Tax=Legionella waltersii TaxID=66969 RepID=A0A0W1ADQ2_9GAMM|nr:hypothetical protein [Legionella waltersii]KTD79448.1 hypothetical protein Lwal_1520 [Legionella waltersii]SNU97594.1 Uncharacterised protein [Legionella waltersii]